MVCRKLLKGDECPISRFGGGERYKEERKREGTRCWRKKGGVYVGRVVSGKRRRGDPTVCEDTVDSGLRSRRRGIFWGWAVVGKGLGWKQYVRGRGRWRGEIHCDRCDDWHTNTPLRPVTVVGKIWGSWGTPVSGTDKDEWSWSSHRSCKRLHVSYKPLSYILVYGAFFWITKTHKPVLCVFPLFFFWYGF